MTRGVDYCIRLLRCQGWSACRIADYVGVSLSEVRRALDPKARAAHERWAR